MPAGTDQSAADREQTGPRGVPMVAIDPDGRVDFASDDWLDRTGYDRETVTGRPFGDFFADGDGDSVIEACLPVGGSVSGGRFDLRLADESVERVQVAAIPEYHDDRFERTHCQFPDLSVRLDATSGHTLGYRLFDLAPVGIFQTSVAGDVLRINPELATMLGCDSVESALDAYDDLASDLYVDPDRRQDFLDRLHEDGVVTDFEYEARRADDETVWLSMNASLTGQLPDGTGVISGFTQDVTERRRHRRELAEERERYSTLVRQSPDGIVIVRSGTIEFVNPRATEILARDRAALVGRSIADLAVDPDRLPDCGGEACGDRPATEIEFDRPNGDRVPVELHAAAIHLDGRPASLYIFRDISERRERERHLRVLDRILRHTIRNRMTVVRGHADQIATDPSAPADDLARTIVATADDLVELADTERDIVELLTDRPQTERVDLRALLDRVAERARQQIPDGRVSVDCPETVAVEAIGRLEAGLYELVENGLVHNERDRPAVSIAVATGETVSVTIADDGPGLPETARAILDGDAEVDPLFHGRGLGLWLAHHAIVRSGGSIAAHTDDGGTRIVIDLARP
ncbi:MAG: PAS domain-containing protein [Halococcoides sp.]